jgi:flagellar motor switch protein FliM
MTEIELNLLKSLGRTLTDPLTEAWEPVYPLAVTSKEPVLSAEFAQVAMPGEATIVFFFEISLFNMTGSLSLCIPHPVIHSALDDLAAQLWAGTGTTNGTEHERLNPSEQLAPVEVLVAAELGRTEMTMRDLVALAPDQIVKLNTPANGAIVLRVAGRDKFTGRPGVVGKNLAVQIVHPLP